jgi:hypothetical protein
LLYALLEPATATSAATCQLVADASCIVTLQQTMNEAQNAGK